MLILASFSSIVPLSGFKNPKIRLRVVDFPAPLAPKRPYISPDLTSIESSESALWSLKNLEIFVSFIINLKLKGLNKLRP